MKASIKNIALVWLVAICAALMAMTTTSCASSRFAEDAKYMKSSMERQMVASNEGDSTRNNEVLYLSSVEDDEVIYPELTAQEMNNAKEVVANTGDKKVDVIIDNTGSRETVVKKAKFLAAKSVRDVEDVFEVKNQPKVTNVQAGKQSKFFRDKNDSLLFYNAQDKTVHEAAYVGYNVLAEKNLTGVYGGVKGGVVF